MVAIINRKLEKNFELIFLVIFSLLFAIQPFIKYCSLYGCSVRLGATLKMALFIVIILGSFFVGLNKKTNIIVILLLFSFLIGQLFLPDKYSVFGETFFEECIKGDVYVTFKYLFIVFFIGFFEKLKSKEKLIKKLLGLFKTIINVNTIFVFTGVIFSISFFQSYTKSPDRFGSQGLLALVGESLYIYLIAIALSYDYYLKSKNPLQLFFLIIGSVFLGKKAIFIFLFLLLLIHFWKIKQKILLRVTIITSFLFLFFSKKIVLLLIKIFPFWETVYNKHGLMYLIFSSRDVLFYRCIDFIKEQWTIVNYLFGGGDFFNTRSEFGFFDIFLNFGIIGFIIYFLFIKHYFLEKQNRCYLFILISILIVEFFSGGMFVNILPMILFYFLAKFFQIKSQDNIYNE